MLDALKTDPPDVVIVAWSTTRDSTSRFGSIREVEACAQIRALPEAADIPLVLLTTRHNQRQTAWNLDVQGYAALPLVTDSFLALITGVVAGQRLWADNQKIMPWVQEPAEAD